MLLGLFEFDLYGRNVNKNYLRKSLTFWEMDFFAVMPGVTRGEKLPYLFFFFFSFCKSYLLSQSLWWYLLLFVLSVFPLVA